MRRVQSVSDTRWEGYKKKMFCTPPVTHHSRAPLASHLPPIRLPEKYKIIKRLFCRLDVLNTLLFFGEKTDLKLNCTLAV